MYRILMEQRLEEIKEDPNIIQYYINNKCKTCKRKGYVERNITLSNNQSYNTKEFCECVLKSIRKEIKDVQNSQKRPENKKEQKKA